MDLDALLDEGTIAVQRGPIFDLEPAPLPARELEDRVRGMMLGLAIGDALGNTSESMDPPARRARFGEIEDYLPHRHAGGRSAGLPTDDTQLAFWTLEHLLDHGRVDPGRLLDLFAGRRIFGMGATVRGALERRRAGREWPQCGLPSAGNGALMRIAPVVFPYLRRPSTELWADTVRAAAITHNDPGSTAACVAFVALLWELLARDTAPDAHWWVERYVQVAAPLEGETCYRARGGRHADYAGPIARFVERHVPAAVPTAVPAAPPAAVAAGTDRFLAVEGWYSGAYLLETVPCVLYLLARHGHDPEAAIVRAVNDTRDNDTVAAIVGAAVGALHGERALPQRWRDGLLGRLGADDDGAVFNMLDRAIGTFLQDR